MPYSTRSLTRQDAPVYIPGYGHVPIGRVPAEVAAEVASRQQNTDWWTAKNAQNDKIRKWATVAALAIGSGGAALGAMGGGAAAGGAAAGGGAAGGGVGTTAGYGSLFGGNGAFLAGGGSAAAGGGGVAAGAGGGAAVASRFPWLAIGSKAVDTLSGIYANRQQMGANREALAYQQTADARAEAIEAAERAEQRRQFDSQQAELKRQWDAEQKFEADKFAASEEERLYNRRLADEREARRQPYRDASAAALARIPGILAGGRTSPGMGSLGSYRSGR